MYGTTDVDSYCWQILTLWPELETGNARFLAGTVQLEDPAFKIYQYPTVYKNEVPADKMHYYWDINKARGMMPHDLGSPRLRPWVVLNAFDWQNGNVWKDLSPKFPLRAYRDFLATGAKDLDFLAKCFAASVTALDTLEKRFGDPQTHIPLNEGIPDQTYDTWKMKGQSAYISMLWLAALKATWTMGGRLVENNITALEGRPVAAVADKYKAWFAAGRASLQKLWDETGGYFHIDAATDDIMADQLFGVWYSTMVGLEDGPADLIIPREQAERALRVIHEKNVLGFGRGIMGAVNGRTKDGGQLFSQQADEVWVGTSYALAANEVLHGLREEALRTAFGVYYVTYSPYGHGYFFKTPEAYCDPEEKQWNNRSSPYGDRVFRAMKYMRPGAVWALAEALHKKGSPG
jgi:non-lysosomal glucosylceramidase